MKKYISCLIVFIMFPVLSQAQYCYDLIPGTTSSEAGGIIGHQNSLYLSAKYNTNSNYRLTGVDIATGTKTIYSFVSYQFVTIGNNLYFAGHPDTGKRFTEIWKFDASGNQQKMTDLSTCFVNAGTVPSTSMSDLVVLNNKIYFFFSANTVLSTPCLPGVKGPIFEYDPVTNTTRSCNIDQNIVRLSPGATQNLTAFKNKLYMNGHNPATGNELWCHDPVANTTTLVTDIEPGSASSFPFTPIVAFNKIFFTAYNKLFGGQLYEYDGKGVAKRVTDLNPGNMHGVFGNPVIYKEQLYFAGDDGVEKGLYRYDPSTSQTARVVAADIVYMAPLGVHDGQLFFTRKTDTCGVEMWKYNLGHGEAMVADMMPGVNDGRIHSFLSYKGNMFFCAQTPANGKEVFRFTGSKVGVTEQTIPTETLRVHPNPANSIAYFDIPSGTTVDISLTDAVGRIVYKKEHSLQGKSNIAISIEHLQQGIYIYSVRTENGKLLNTGKLLKQ